MFKKLVIVALVLMLVGCTNASADPVTLDGVWQSVEKENIPLRMSAIVEDGEITIHILDDNSRSLYWVGTAPEELSSNDTFVSDADTDQLDRSLLGSLDEDKEFFFENGALSFEQGMLGTKWMVTMRKVE